MTTPYDRTFVRTRYDPRQTSTRRHAAGPRNAPRRARLPASAHPGAAAIPAGRDPIGAATSRMRRQQPARHTRPDIGHQGSHRRLSKGRRVPEADREVRATQNWVAKSFFAQYSNDAFHETGTRIRQVPMPKEPDPPASWAEELPPLEAPAGRRMTDQFLRELTRAYAIAARNGTPPAPAIAAATGVSPRTVHKWVSTARRRGIMPPGKQGRVG
jgi:hypothetical protein